LVTMLGFFAQRDDYVVHHIVVDLRNKATGFESHANYPQCWGTRPELTVGTEGRVSLRKVVSYDIVYHVYTIMESTLWLQWNR
jgi:hypothetical protein